MLSPSALGSGCHACYSSLEIGILPATSVFSGYPLGVVRKQDSQQGVLVSKLVLTGLEYLLRGVSVVGG